MLLFIGVLPCLADLRCCEIFVWKIEHQVSTVLYFSFFSCNHRRSQGSNGTIPPTKFLACVVILCFDRQCPNKIPLLVILFGPPKNIWAGYATACNHFHTDGLHLSRVQPCSSVSSLSHGTFLFDVQSSTDKKFAKTQERQTLQDSHEKQYSNSIIA